MRKSSVREVWCWKIPSLKMDDFRYVGQFQAITLKNVEIRSLGDPLFSKVYFEDAECD